MGFMSSLPAPTCAEAIRMRLITEGWCIACWHLVERTSLCEVHHLTVGGKHGAPRRGHAFTVGLCIWHHRGVLGSLSARHMADEFGPSYAIQPALFRRLMGRDEGLLRIQSHRLKVVCASYVRHPGRYADPHVPGGFVDANSA